MGSADPAAFRMNLSSLIGPSAGPASAAGSATSGDPGTARETMTAFSPKPLPLRIAESEFGFSRASSWRHRKRHGLRALHGRRVNRGDIPGGFETERNGRRKMPVNGKDRP